MATPYGQSGHPDFATGGPEGYDNDHDDNDDQSALGAHGLPGGQQMRLLGSLGDEEDEGGYEAPSEPGRSYHPNNQQYQELARQLTPPPQVRNVNTAIGYESTQSPAPSFGGSHTAIGYDNTPLSPESRYGTPASHSRLTPAPSRLSENRSWTPSNVAEWTASQRGGGPGNVQMERSSTRGGGVPIDRAWTPSRNSGVGQLDIRQVDYSRPPPLSTAPYVSRSLNGTPRPGSVISSYSRRSRDSQQTLPESDYPSGQMKNPYMSGETMIPVGDDISDYQYTDLGDSQYGPGASNMSGYSDDLKREITNSSSGEDGRTYTMGTESDGGKLAAQTKGAHFGPAPHAPQTRRGLNRQALMTKKQVKLINGELILECKIPTILYSFLPRRDAQEFTHMRYTAVTCDPDEYANRGYLLRQNIDPTRRETELFICVTMYNENEILFTRTMHGVMRNIAHFCARSKSRVWGKDGWKKIVVCIVADGRKKIHPRVLDALAAMGVYQDGIAKNSVNGREVKAHVYEYTTQVSLDSDLKFKGAEKGIVPVQMVFCLKEKNAKKLNSHRWFFNAFGATLSPNVCILLDVGTRPGNTSLYHLWKAFDTDSNVGGACGEIKAMKGKGWMGLFNPLVASQNFEYKMSNILDKPLESVFGYITVLPGALSAYRYHALQNDENGHGPLSQYFKGETLHGKDADVFTANMYLAEDRILCWELVAKRSERWVLKYVRAATGETDVPDSVPEFISQRRRWLNGAFFAAIFSLAHFKQIWSTDHTYLRKSLLHIEFLYQFASLVFTFFSLANFYLSFYFIAGSLADATMDPFGHGWGARIFVFLRFACVLLICTQFIVCMGNRPQGAKRMFMSSMVVYAVIMAYTTFCGMYIVVKSFTGGVGDQVTEIVLGDNIFTNLIVSVGSTMGVYFLMSFLYLDPWHMFTSSAQYFMMLPSYICTLQVYAFCNTHDVSWGTKGDNTVSVDLGAAVASKGDTVELEMPSEQLDIDSGYDDALRNLRDRLEVPEDPISEGQIQEDYYRAVRTYVVVVWMVANAILAMIVTEAYPLTEMSGNFYLKFLLWSVAALAVFRALGSTTYLILQGLHRFVEGRVKFDPTLITNRFQPAWKQSSSSKFQISMPWTNKKLVLPSVSNLGKSV